MHLPSSLLFDTGSHILKSGGTAQASLLSFLLAVSLPLSCFRHSWLGLALPVELLHEILQWLPKLKVYPQHQHLQQHLHFKLPSKADMIQSRLYWLTHLLIFLCLIRILSLSLITISFLIVCKKPQLLSYVCWWANKWFLTTYFSWT